jgi:methionyl-tRNA synthetase
VPFPRPTSDGEKQTTYVWFDALPNYWTATRFPGSRAAWPAQLHVIGKDITRFHTVIWPAMLMSAKLPIPRKVFAHGFMTFAGQRMSKSNPGTIVSPVEAAQRHGVDALRLYLTKEIVFGEDGDFSWERFDEKYNSDLANNLGNLVSRVTAMANQYRQGQLAPTGAGTDRLVRIADELAREYRRAMNALEIHMGAAAVFRLVDATNEYIASNAPWALAKDPSKADALTQVLFDSAEAVRLAAVLLSPFMPASSGEILRRIGAWTEVLGLDRDGRWRPEGERRLVQDAPLWPRFDRKHVKEKSVSEPVSANPTGTVANPEPAKAPTEPASVKTEPERISIDQFMGVELSTAKVISAENVPKSKKLIKLHVDLGNEQRTILAGIAEAYQPEALVGRTIVVVANLKPAKLMGIESNGMVLAASSEGGQPVLLSVEAEPGWRVR